MQLGALPAKVFLELLSEGRLRRHQLANPLRAHELSVLYRYGTGTGLRQFRVEQYTEKCAEP